MKFSDQLLFAAILAGAASVAVSSTFAQNPPNTPSAGCDAINQDAADFAAAGPTDSYLTHAFPLRPGERVNFVVKGSTGASGSITFADESGDSQQILAGEVPQTAFFIAPVAGAYRFQYRAAKGSIAFTASCEPAGSTGSPLTSTSAFLERRADRLLSEDTAQASFQRRAAVASATPGKAMSTSTVLDDQGNATQISVSTSALALGAAQGTSPTSKLDFWIDAHMSRYEESIEDNGQKISKNGRFGMAYVGADYLVTQNILVGALVQFDHLDETLNDYEASIRGSGLMAGPYTSVRIAPDLIFDARAAWGTSRNIAESAEDGSFGFDTNRELIRAQLTGNRKFDGFELSPSVSFGLVEENLANGGRFLDGGQDSFTTTTGRFGLGSALSYRIALENGGFLTPKLALSTSWDTHDFEDLNALFGAFSNGAGAKAEAGFTLSHANGFDLQASGSLEGIGEHDFAAWSTKLSLTTPLN